jgi:hypothetical protein
VREQGKKSLEAPRTWKGFFIGFAHVAGHHWRAVFRCGCWKLGVEIGAVVWSVWQVLGCATKTVALSVRVEAL